MSTFADRSGVALLVIDVQDGVVQGAWRRAEVLAAIKSLVGRAREAGAPVIWVRHSDEELPFGSDAWQIVSELKPADGEPIVDKRYGDSFEDTNLADLLADGGIGHLVLCGAQTEACVLATSFGAFVRGYDVTLAGDAHTTVDLTQWGMIPPEQAAQAVNVIWRGRTAPGRTAAVLPAAEIGFS